MAYGLVNILEKQVAKYGYREMLRYKDYETGVWTKISWHSFKNTVDEVAASLYEGGIAEGARVGVFTQNCPEILMVHFASFYNRIIPVPIYATSSKEEVRYLVEDATLEIVFAGDQKHYDIAHELMKEDGVIKQIVTLNTTVRHASDDTTTMTWKEFCQRGSKCLKAHHDAVMERSARADENDTAFLIYTSGTTGRPKGVILAHEGWTKAMDYHMRLFQSVTDEDLSLCFLPLSHVFELGWTMVCISIGARVAINYNPKEIARTVAEIHPTCMCSVPRFWEKVYVAVQDKLAKASTVQRKLMEQAIKIGKIRNLGYVRSGKHVPPHIAMQYAMMDKLVLSKIRAAIGVTNPKLFPTAGAMLSDNITEFLHSVGINIAIGYGLTETTATVTCFHPRHFVIGSIGRCLPGVRVKIGENNEILVKGPTVMRGYFNKPEETAKVLDADGWFHTGDAGSVDASGSVYMTERLKDLFKTSNGKYIAPQALETLLVEDKFIEQVAVIGDRRKFVTALIIPDFVELNKYAAANGIECENNDQLVNHPAIYEMLMERINEMQAEMASYEQIKRITILPRAFSMSKGELTNTLKIRRPVIAKLYAEQIEAMYKE